MTTQTALFHLQASMDAPEASVDDAATLLRRARRGEPGAFEELLAEHERLVYATALRRLGSREDAKDAAQEVFLRLYRHLDRLDPRRPLAAWLYRVTVNVCNSEARRSARRREDDLTDAGRVEDRDPHNDPEARLALREQERMIRHALRRLSEKEREVLLLRDVEGMSTRDVAEALSTSEVTVRTHICRGRRKLAEFRRRWKRNES